MQLAAGDPGLDRRDRALERFLAEPVVLRQLLGHLADDEDARHVREAAGLAVAREKVEADRLTGGDRARAHVVADGRLGAVRDDELVGKGSVHGERLLHGRLEELAGERLAVDDEVAVGLLGRPQ